ncbi:putative transcription factor C2H2 family [Helianthus annuus]|nr:putative transcription factor C2H2 family [Helianthus annuus]
MIEFVLEMVTLTVAMREGGTVREMLASWRKRCRWIWIRRRVIMNKVVVMRMMTVVVVSLTCCGHLFCWCCFYQMSYVDSSAKECPVCEGEVTDSSVTPIYGNGRNEPVLKLENGVKIPPRLQARRVESVRQQRVIRGISHIPVAEALRRIKIGIGSIGEHNLQGVNSVLPGSETYPSLLHGSEAGGSRRHRSRQFSRVISESVASLPSISSALNNAERLVEDLETYISDSLLRRTDAQILPSNQEMDTLYGETVETQPEPQHAEMSPSLPLSTSSQRSVSTTIVQVDINR